MAPRAVLWKQQNYPYIHIHMHPMQPAQVRNTSVSGNPQQASLASTRRISTHLPVDHGRHSSTPVACTATSDHALQRRTLNPYRCMDISSLPRVFCHSDHYALGFYGMRRHRVFLSDRALHFTIAFYLCPEPALSAGNRLATSSHSCTIAIGLQYGRSAEAKPFRVLGRLI